MTIAPSNADSTETIISVKGQPNSEAFSASEIEKKVEHKRKLVMVYHIRRKAEITKSFTSFHAKCMAKMLKG